MAYVESNNISVYPTAFRDKTVDSQSYLNTEFNLTNLKFLSDEIENQSFSYKFDDEYDILYIHGYFFKVKGSSIPRNNLYAYIHLFNTTIDGVYTNFVLSNEDDNQSLDDNGYFKGLMFGNEIPESTGNHLYFGVKVNDENGNRVYQKLKLSTSEIRDASGNALNETITTSRLNVNQTANIQLLNTDTIENVGTIQSSTFRGIDFEGNTFSGNAATATKLQSGRKINGTNFDGSGDIITSSWGTPRKVTVFDNSMSNSQDNSNIDGGADIQLKLPSTIKATFVGTGLTNGASLSSSNGTIVSNDLSGESPSASGSSIAFIDMISQAKDGKITATKKNVQDASTSSRGVVSIGEQTFGGKKTFNNGVEVKDGLQADEIKEGTTLLTEKYLGKSAKASDSAKLNGKDASYYLDFNNLVDTPTIGDGEIEIQRNAVKVDSFRTNDNNSEKKVIDIKVPTFSLDGTTLTIINNQ